MGGQHCSGGIIQAMHPPCLAFPSWPMAAALLSCSLYPLCPLASSSSSSCIQRC